MEIKWYLQRLSKMPPGEILYRFTEKLHQRTDKRKNFYCPRSFVQPSKKLWTLSEQATAELISEYFPDLSQRILENAARYLQNQFDVFGLEANFEGKIDWHLDPKTGNRWPEKFWADIDHRDGKTIGGVKFVWEINRLYFLPILGFAYRVSSEAKYARKIVATVREWQEENPYPIGINWTSGIELGIRIANLIWALSFLKDYTFAKEDYESINRFIFFHARHLFRYPSKYSSNNNHALAEALGLFLAGVFFPHLPGATKWRNFGRSVLEREVSRQILPDGGSFEYSTTYLSLVFDFFLLYRIVCDRLGIEYGKAIDERLERSCEYIHLLMDKNGNIPNIGDQDSAVLVNFGLDNRENFRSILNTGAVLFSRPEFRQSNFPDFKTYMLLGEAVNDTRPNHMVHKIKGSKLLAESGLTVIREEIEGKEIVFTGNATPLGMPPLYPHGHLDALSFTLAVDGKEIFVDPGTYLYHSGGKWRRYFRSTAAHNTVRINGKDMTEQVADFMFGKPYRITEHSLSMETDKITWQAGHDAYQKLKVPVLHQRRIVFRKPAGSFEILDILRSSGRYLAEQFFHFHPKCSLELDEKVVTVRREDLVLMIQLDAQVEVDLFKGSREPLLGWFSSAFNHIEASNTLVCTANCEGDAELRTEINFACC